MNINNEKKYPLLKKYAILKGKEKDFLDYFSKEQLDDFEEALHLYFVEGSITYDEIEGLTINPISTFRCSETYSFNRDILRLACGLITYDDFMQEYKTNDTTIYDLIVDMVSEYFRENKIKDLSAYGADVDNLQHLTDMYKEIIDKLNVPYTNIYTNEDTSTCKYITTINLKNDCSIGVNTNAYDGIKKVVYNLESVYKFYKEKEQKQKDNDEIDLDMCG